MFLESFIQMHNENVFGALYELHDRVEYNHPTAGNGTGAVVAMANTGDEMEYAVDGCPVLLWEHEIKGKIE